MRTEILSQGYSGPGVMLTTYHPVLRLRIDGSTLPLPSNNFTGVNSDFTFPSLCYKFSNFFPLMCFITGVIKVQSN